jgi:hypothetical protein
MLPFLVVTALLSIAKLFYSSCLFFDKMAHGQPADDGYCRFGDSSGMGKGRSVI